MPTESVPHQDAIIDLIRDYVYFLIYPFPNDGAAYKSTVYTLNKKFQQIEAEMAKKPNGTGTSKTDAPNGDALKWINRNLTSEEKAHHDAQEKSPKELGVLLFKIASEGYNIRVAWDSYSKCFQANIIPYQPENPNFGYALSARGVTPSRAVSLLLYKHYAVFEENWSNHYQAPSNSFEG